MERCTKSGFDFETTNLTEGLTDSMGTALNRLSAYEDAEEQGLLVRLPCKVGDTVYELTEGFSIYKPGLHVYISEHTATELNIYNWARRGDFGKTVFLTREEAEAALQEANRNG